METENRSVVARGWGQRGMKRWSTGDFGQQKFSVRHYNDGFTSLNICPTTARPHHEGTLRQTMDSGDHVAVEVINYNKCTTWWGMLMAGQQCLPLSFAVNPKLLYNIKFIKKKKIKRTLMGASSLVSSRVSGAFVGFTPAEMSQR